NVRAILLLEPLGDLVGGFLARVLENALVPLIRDRTLLFCSSLGGWSRCLRCGWRLRRRRNGRWFATNSRFDRGGRCRLCHLRRQRFYEGRRRTIGGLTR